MTIWLVEPRDPLIVREGRPFGPDPGAWATSLPFPFPSTLAGGVRTRSGLDENGTFKYGHTDKEQLNRLKEIRIRGPWLVQLAADSNGVSLEKWLVPAPNDALLISEQPVDDEEDESASIRRLVPLPLLPQAQTDFDSNDQEKHLLLVGQRDYDQRKPLTHKLRYWYWDIFQTWLTYPAQLAGKTHLISTLGRKDLIREQRLHVSIDSNTEMGKDGLLFGTSGLEFTHPGKAKKRLKDAERLALALAVDDEEFEPRAGVASFAGERRIVTWRKSEAQLPTCPTAIEQAIKQDHYCRLVLLTPSYFERGYYPTRLRTEAAEQYGIEIEIQAIAVQRPQVVSGWDLALSSPKPSRRLAPAGTVFFLSIRGDDAAISTWIEKTWMQCISDEEQDRRDGFGLTVVGTWSGPVSSDVEKERAR